MKIRKYISTDEAQVRKIHLDTYFIGKPISLLTKKISFFNSGADYYINKEPESIFIAEDRGKVVGYVFGCLDDKKCPSEARFILPLLFMVFKSTFMNKKEKRFWGGKLKFILKLLSGKSGELNVKEPKNAGHLHINLLPKYRGKGIGSKLLKKFLSYAKSNNVKVVHAGSFRTKVNPNSNFWLKNGFKVYDKGNSTFWLEQYPKEKIEVVCYSKMLNK
jgi:GNAT superfamily N-acetyltransferase